MIDNYNSLYGKSIVWEKRGDVMFRKLGGCVCYCLWIEWRVGILVFFC